jgi:hypothetical protein
VSSYLLLSYMPHCSFASEAVFENALVKVIPHLIELLSGTSSGAAASLLLQFADRREFFPAHCLGHIVHFHLKRRSRMRLLKLFHVSLSSSQVMVVKLRPSFFQSL